MKKELHTVLGANGSVGKEVVNELRKRNLDVRLVRKTKIVGEDDYVIADMMNLLDAKRAIAGSTHVYVCIGFKYDKKIWESSWPKAIENIINACEEEKARIIFLDNIYMYGPEPLRNPIEENHKQEPTAKKGITRKKVAEMLLKAHNEKRVKVVIGRSADFYGKGSKTSPLYISFLERMLNGKPAQSLSALDAKHTYSNVKDNGRALVRLALDETSYGEVWHLPTSGAVTFREVNEKFNNILGTNLEIKKISKFMRSLLAVIVPPIKELSEMLYQFDNMYILDSHKFMKKYPDFKVTSIDDGLNEMVESFV